MKQKKTGRLFFQVFGEIVKGYEVVEKIENMGSYSGRPKKSVVIAACGEVTKAEA